MKLNSHKLLREITQQRRVSLVDLEPFIEQKFGDYRDLYPLACLCISGYVGHRNSLSDSRTHDEHLLASILYAKLSGEKKVNEYNNPGGRKGVEGQIFTTTAKAELYLSELSSKRLERAVTAVVGIVVGVSSALITLFVKHLV